MGVGVVVVILGQTVRLLPIIGEADKEATYPSHVRLHSNMIMMMLLLLLLLMMMMMVVMMIMRRC